MWGGESAVYLNGVAEDATGNNPNPTAHGTIASPTNGLLGKSYSFDNNTAYNIGTLGDFGSKIQKSATFLFKGSGTIAGMETYEGVFSITLSNSYYSTDIDLRGNYGINPTSRLIYDSSTPVADGN